ncbi:MAG: hypothetical protein JW770_06640, partial [Actinobacteria bacterium]|nr:hypothetical protein [Actinomycetota bacterium]
MEREEVLEKIFRILSDFSFYKDSVKTAGNGIFLIGRGNNKKYLFIVGEEKACSQFDGEISGSLMIKSRQCNIKKCSLSHNNLAKIKSLFPQINPVLCNKKSSFGTGDRLGMVTAAHIKAFEGRDIFPVLAQQSVRELSRTKSDWNDVMSSAIWGYFESGSRMPFGADADHIKEEGGLKDAVDAGFTMFTVDPSDHIVNTVNLDRPKISGMYRILKEKSLLEKKYEGKSLKIAGKEYHIDKDQVTLMAVKYWRALKMVSGMYSFLKEYKKQQFDFEVSMDEIEEPVTPLDHYFISGELLDSGVEFDNLALRYPG